MHVRAEILGVVVERLLDGVHHPGNVPGMLLVVIHLQFDPVPFFARHLIVGGHEGIEVHGGMVELVLKVAAAVLLPLADKRARRDCDLTGRSADYAMYIHQIGMATQVGVTAIVGAVPLKRRHQIDLF